MRSCSTSIVTLCMESSARWQMYFRWFKFISHLKMDVHDAFFIFCFEWKRIQRQIHGPELWTRLTSHRPTSCWSATAIEDLVGLWWIRSHRTNWTGSNCRSQFWRSSFQFPSVRARHRSVLNILDSYLPIKYKQRAWSRSSAELKSEKWRNVN